MNHPTPPFPQRPPSGQSKHLWSFAMLQSDAARHRINQMWVKTQGDESLTLAISSDALVIATHHYANMARDKGQLLFCWHGTMATTVPDSPLTQGGAA